MRWYGRVGVGCGYRPASQHPGIPHPVEKKFKKMYTKFVFIAFSTGPTPAQPITAWKLAPSSSSSSAWSCSCSCSYFCSWSWSSSPSQPPTDTVVVNVGVAVASHSGWIAPQARKSWMLQFKWIYSFGIWVPRVSSSGGWTCQRLVLVLIPALSVSSALWRWSLRFSRISRILLKQKECAKKPTWLATNQF